MGASFTGATVTTSVTAVLDAANELLASLLVALTPRLMVPLKSKGGVMVRPVICAGVNVQTPPLSFVPAEKVAPVGTLLMV